MEAFSKSKESDLFWQEQSANKKHVILNFVFAVQKEEQLKNIATSMKPHLNVGGLPSSKICKNAKKIFSIPVTITFFIFFCCYDFWFLKKSDNKLNFVNALSSRSSCILSPNVYIPPIGFPPTFSIPVLPTANTPLPATTVSRTVAATTPFGTKLTFVTPSSLVYPSNNCKFSCSSKQQQESSILFSVPDHPLSSKALYSGKSTRILLPTFSSILPHSANKNSHFGTSLSKIQQQSNDANYIKESNDVSEIFENNENSEYDGVMNDKTRDEKNTKCNNIVASSPTSSLSKGDIIALVSKCTDTKKSNTEKTINAFLNVIGSSLLEQKKVTLHNFGRFYLRLRQQRNGRNPKTGESMVIPEIVTPAFSFAKKFRVAVKSTVSPEDVNENSVVADDIEGEEAEVVLEDILDKAADRDNGIKNMMNDIQEM